MIPQSDLFNQVEIMNDGFYTITKHMERVPVTHVYTPHDEWCGCTNAICEESRKAAITQIIKFRINYEKTRN